VILLVSKDQSGKGLPENKHKLQPPFHEITAYGDILLTRSDDDGEAAHFPLAEYLTFKDTVITDWKSPSDEDDEEDEEDDEEVDDDMIEMDEAEALRRFLPPLVEAFMAEYKREPNEDELEELKGQILDGGDEDAEEMFQLALPQLVATFTQQNGREPTEEEIEEIREQVFADDSDDEEDDEDGDDGEELEAVMEQLVPKLVASFLEQNGRAPTDAEVEVLKDRLKANLMAQVQADGSDDDEEEEESDDDEDKEAYAQIEQQKGF